MNISDVLSVIKLKPKFIFILSVSSGVILFIPKDYKKTLSLDFEGIYNNILGVTFVVSTILWLYIVGEFIYNRINRSIRSNKMGIKVENKIIEMLNELSVDEQNILSQFYFEDKKVLKLNVFDPIINEMCNKSILDIVCMPGTNSYEIGHEGTPVKINELVRKRIRVTIIERQPNKGYSYRFGVLESK
ncbi:super-infection exclusion protein B [Myroides odoratus]|uniref:super-infection exclusion protein B n=1 Tax=Myroides odoratus TaxID=256 RepID=UPI000765DF33|nr:super-infection exclusion protein B [Myroides odoratus]